MTPKKKSLLTARTDEPEATGVIRFKFLRNQMVPALSEHVPNGRLLLPPHSTRLAAEADVRDDSTWSGTRKIQRYVSHFDMNVEHEIPLPQVEPKIVAMRPGMTEAWREALQAKQYALCLENQDRADKLRRLLKNLSSPDGGNVIEITFDPDGFMSASPFLTDEEAELRRRADEEAEGVRMMQMQRLRSGK